MTPPRFQFTIRNILWATFWVTVSCISWIDYKPADQNPPLMFAMIAGRIVVPFIAVGALFGHAFLGFLVCFVLLGGYALLGWIIFGF